MCVPAVRKLALFPLLYGGLIYMWGYIERCHNSNFVELHDLKRCRTVLAHEGSGDVPSTFTAL